MCNSVCFHLPWYEASCRPEQCVWRGGRFAEQARAVVGNLGLDGGHLLGVWGRIKTEKEGERENVGSSGNSAVYMC